MKTKIKKNMKTILLIIGLVIFFNSKASATEVLALDNIKTSSKQNGGIKDGWYEATVKYSNYSTGTNATYTLKVKAEYGSVSAIDFGNGGSIHSGYNNEGYLYSGGYLSFEKDYEGNIIAATATVSTSDSDGLRNYSIRIE